MAAKKGARGGVSSEQLSELFGVHVKTVALWIKQGMPVASRAGRANSIDVGAAIRWRMERLAADHEEKLAEARSSPELDQIRARKMRAESRRLEAEADRVEGAQVLVADVEQAWSRIASAIREGVLSLAPRAVQIGVIAPDKEDALADLSRDVLREIAEPERLAS